MNTNSIPEQPLRKKYLEPILFLADRMANADGMAMSQQRHMIEALAKAADLQDFRDDLRFRQMSDLRACEMLEDSEDAKNAALVVIALILKADHEQKEEELAYFSKIRGKLEHSPISVPTDLQHHKELALKLMDRRDAPSA